MTKQTETKTPAQKLRAALKAAGYKPSAISVRNPRGAFNVTIKDKAIPLDAIEEIARSFESVSRCHVSGEILSGGNTFVFVQYADTVEKEFEAIAEAIGEIPMGGQIETPKGSIICRPIGAGFNTQYSAQIFGGICPVDGRKYYNTVARTFSLDGAIAALHNVAQY